MARRLSAPERGYLMGYCRAKNDTQRELREMAHRYNEELALMQDDFIELTHELGRVKAIEENSRCRARGNGCTRP
jgi:hypothetical protein